LKPDSLREQIYADLRARLQRCEFSPEHRLIDVEIATTYGTSRMPVREALLKLVNEGYLVGTTRGFAVPTLSLEDVREIFEVRKLLEPRAAANAARDMDEDTERALAAAMREAHAAVAADDVERLILANIDFRSAWLGAVRNTRLAGTIARFVDQVQAVRLGTLRHATTRQIVIHGLEEIYDAFVQRDPLAASDRMMAFIAAAEQAFFATHRGAQSADPANGSETDRMQDRVPGAAEAVPPTRLRKVGA